MRCIEIPLTAKQCKELQGYVALSTQLFRGFLFVIFIAGLGLVLRGTQQAINPAGAPWWVFPTGAFAMVLFVYSKRWTGGREFRKSVRKDLTSGKARALIVEPVSVIEFEEEEDEGPSYLVETADGETVFLAGQYLEPYKHRKFPWSRFHIIEAPFSGVIFRIERRGDPIPVDETRPALAYEIAKKLGCFKHRYVVLDEKGKALASKTP